MTEQQLLLASAYLDGELTADDRLLAEADRTVMDLVEGLRAVQDAVADVPVSDRRETAIAAAMAEFRAEVPGRSVDPVVRPLPTRPAYSRYLAVAAGVIGVGLVGVVIANLDTGSDDSAAMDAATFEPAAEEPAASEPAAEDAAMAMAEPAEVAEVAEAGSDAAAEMAADEPAAEEPAEEPAAEPLEEPAAEPNERYGPMPTLVDGQVLTSAEELGAYGTALWQQLVARELGPTPNHACPIDDVLGRASYESADGSYSVLVAVDEGTATVSAFDDETCAFVGEGPLYQP
jgi:hypothetical protein